MPTISNNAVAKVKAVLDGWEAAWNASDMNAMWQLATDDIHWINVVGMHWRGKAEVQKAICKRGAFIGFDRQGGPGDAQQVPMVMSLIAVQ